MANPGRPFRAWLMRLCLKVSGWYPKSWRTRYGEELRALIEDEGGNWRHLSDLTRAAASERLEQLTLSLFGRTTARAISVFIEGVLVFGRMLMAAYAGLLAFYVLAVVLGLLMLGQAAKSAVLHAATRNMTEFLSGEFMWVPILLAYSLVLSGPVAIVLRWSRFGRRHHWIARLLFLLAFAVFPVWIGFRAPLWWTLGAAGCVGAAHMFPHLPHSPGYRP